jgi:hypothetical protein
MDRIASVEVTSEQPGYPIESALRGESRGWRAANPGTQIARMIFDHPQTLSRIWLVFEDSENARTQEFVLRWSRGQESSFREIVRQPWNFSPGGSVRENDRHDANQVENELEPFCRLRYSAQPAHASPPPLEFSEIKRRIQFTVDCAEQRLNAVFFADYTADSNSVRFEFQLSGLIKREHHNWNCRHRS